MKENFRYDNLSIDQIEKNLRLKEIFLAGVFFGFVVFYLAFILNAENLVVFATKKSQEVETENQIKVSAQVPVFLGVKTLKVDENLKQVSYLVFGNSPLGFSFSNLNGDILFQSDLVPGDGIFVKLPKLEDGIIFKQNY